MIVTQYSYGVRIAELATVFRQSDVDLASHCRYQIVQKGCGDVSIRCFKQLLVGDLARAIDGNEQTRHGFVYPDLSNVNMDIADWIRIEFLLPPRRALSRASNWRIP